MTNLKISEKSDDDIKLDADIAAAITANAKAGAVDPYDYVNRLLRDALKLPPPDAGVNNGRSGSNGG